MKIINAKVFGADFKFHQREIGVSGKKFGPSQDGQVVDASGLTALPGLVDLHFHGAAGYDFMEGTTEALTKIAQYEAKSGITSISPATMTMSKEQIVKACENAKNFKVPDDCADLVGINMEGPFVSPNRVGAQNPKYTAQPSAGFFRDVQKAAGGLVKLLAIAPELDNAIETITELKNEVLSSIAHTTADYDIAAKAIAAGATHITHLYNAMPGLAHRAPGPIAAGSDAKWCEAEIICDGIHIHPAAVRCAFRLFGAERMILISDSMMATGLNDGIYELGGQKVTVKGRLATLDSGTIAGSATNLFECMRVVVKKMGLPLEVAARCASYNPARSIGILDTAGTIEDGKKADLLLVDDELNLKAVLLRGKWLFNNI